MPRERQEHSPQKESEYNARRVYSCEASLSRLAMRGKQIIVRELEDILKETRKCIVSHSFNCLTISKYL